MYGNARYPKLISLIFFYQLGLLSPLPSGEKEVSQTPHLEITTEVIVVKQEMYKLVIIRKVATRE